MATCAFGHPIPQYWREGHHPSWPFSPEDNVRDAEVPQLARALRGAVGPCNIQGWGPKATAGSQGSACRQVVFTSPYALFRERNIMKTDIWNSYFIITKSPFLFHFYGGGGGGGGGGGVVFAVAKVIAIYLRSFWTTWSDQQRVIEITGISRKCGQWCVSWYVILTYITVTWYGDTSVSNRLGVQVSIKDKRAASLAPCEGGRRIPLKKGQQCGNSFSVITSPYHIPGVPRIMHTLRDLCRFVVVEVSSDTIQSTVTGISESTKPIRKNMEKWPCRFYTKQRRYLWV